MMHSNGAISAESLMEVWRQGNVLAAECPSRRILQHLTSRWGVLVMVALATGPHRFAALRRRIAGVSERMLSQVLKDLESDGFVLRTALPVVPPHVEYELTALGREAASRLIGLVGWIEAELPAILAAGSGGGTAPLPEGENMETARS